MTDSPAEAQTKVEAAEDRRREEEQRPLPVPDENGMPGSCDQIGQLVNDVLAVATEQLTLGDHGAELLVDKGPIGTLHYQEDGVSSPTGKGRKEQEQRADREASSMHDEQETVVQRTVAKVEKVVETTLVAGVQIEPADSQRTLILGASSEKELLSALPNSVLTFESKEEAVVVVDGRETRSDAGTEEKAATGTTNDVSTRAWPDGSGDEINAAKAEQKIANVAEVETAAGGVETSVYSDKLASMIPTEGEEQKVDSAPNDEPIPMIDDGSPEAGAALTAAESLDGAGKEATGKNGQQLKDNSGSDSASRGTRFRQRMKHACSLM